MNLKISLILLSFYSFSSFASGVLVKDGEVYNINLVKMQKEKCGSLQSPIYTAAMFNMNFKRGVSIEFHKARCANSSRQDCTSEDFKKSGQIGVFSFIRKFPSRFTSEGCKALRNKCEEDCNSLGLFNLKTCIIECNQYEKYNK